MILRVLHIGLNQRRVRLLSILVAPQVEEEFSFLGTSTELVHDL